MWHTAISPGKTPTPHTNLQGHCHQVMALTPYSSGAYFAAEQKNKSYSFRRPRATSFLCQYARFLRRTRSPTYLSATSPRRPRTSAALFYDRYNIREPYFQDDWRVTRTHPQTSTPRASMRDTRRRLARDIGSPRCYHPNAASTSSPPSRRPQ